MLGHTAVSFQQKILERSSVPQAFDTVIRHTDECGRGLGGGMEIEQKAKKQKTRTKSRAETKLPIGTLGIVPKSRLKRVTTGIAPRVNCPALFFQCLHDQLT
jgi:hypothetical protein